MEPSQPPCSCPSHQPNILQSLLCPPRHQHHHYSNHQLPPAKRMRLSPIPAAPNPNPKEGYYRQQVEAPSGYGYYKNGMSLNGYPGVPVPEGVKAMFATEDISPCHSPDDSPQEYSPSPPRLHLTPEPAYPPEYPHHPGSQYQHQHRGPSSPRLRYSPSSAHYSPELIRGSSLPQETLSITASGRHHPYNRMHGSPTLQTYSLHGNSPRHSISPSFTSSYERAPSTQSAPSPRHETLHSPLHHTMSPAPTPSPKPQPQSSKLFGILQGFIPEDYSHLSRSVTRAPTMYDSGSEDARFAKSPSSIEQDQPMDLSCKQKREIPSDTCSTTSSRSSTSDGDLSQEFSEKSLLRDLLSFGKLHAAARAYSPCPSEGSSSDDCDTRAKLCNGKARVTLAKKNLFPVSARVSDWLVKIVQFAKSIKEFTLLTHNDKVTLILNSWARIMLLYMAENHFHFAVTPDMGHSKNSSRSPGSDLEIPTMRSVEGIQGFIRKCQAMNLDGKEYTYLRMNVLFDTDLRGLDEPEQVSSMKSHVQDCLQQHIHTSHANDVMHYSRVLLCLPTLFGINCQVVENLFCSHITGNMDMEVLLKEMLQNL